MAQLDWTQTSEIAPDGLPSVITAYLVAHQARDLDSAVAHYAADAVVTDEGHRYHGPGEIRAWLARSASEYTYTSTLTAARGRHDGATCAVSARGLRRGRRPAGRRRR